MPLVHIVAENREDAEQLEKDLYARGFSVLIVAPGQEPSEPADFQITLGEYSRADALQAAAEMATSEDLTVLIAPGAIVESPQPVQTIPIMVEAETGGDSTFVAAYVTSEQGDEMTAEPELVTQSAETPAEDAVNANSLIQSDATNLEVLAEISDLASASQFADAMAEPVADGPEPPAIEPVFAQTDAVEAEIAPEPVTTQDGGLPEEEPIPELEAIRSELDRVVPEFELPLPSMGATSESTQFDAQDVDEPISDWPIWQPVAAIEPQAAEEFFHEIEVAPPAPRSMPALTLTAIRTRFSGDERLFWRTATVASVVAIAALVLGSSYHRVSPLPAAVIGGPAALPAVPVSLPVRMPQSQPPTGPSSVPATLPVLKSAAVRQREVPARSTSSKSDVDIVAPDTVVRYNKRPPTAPGHSSKRVVSSNHHQSDSDVVAQDTVTRFGKSTGATGRQK